MLRAPHFAAFNDDVIILLEKFLKNYMFLPLIILEIFLIFINLTSKIPNNVYTRLGKIEIELLLTLDREIIST